MLLPLFVCAVLAGCSVQNPQTCQPTQVLCDSSCVSVERDTANCGACGNVCATGESCTAGQCGLQCPPGLTNCSGRCVDSAIDPGSCGACGNACASGEVCTAGQCGLQCAAGFINCAGRCVDPTTDRAFCGASATCSGPAESGSACPTGEVCAGGSCAPTCQVGAVLCDGRCIDPLTSPAHCGARENCADEPGAPNPGAAGVSCQAGTVCSLGQCAAQCLQGQLLCAGECVNPLVDPRFCGASSDCMGPLAGARCAPGEACSAGACVISCPTGQVNCNSRCVEPLSDPTFCGASGECEASDGGAGRVCPGGTVCSQGQCSTSCLSSQLQCAGRCVDPATDTQFCGASGDCTGGGSGLACPSGQRCTGGECVFSCPAPQVACDRRCVDPTNDRLYCGANADCNRADGGAGTVCGPALVCSAGSCQPSCPSNQAFCNGVCINPGTSNQYCGASIPACSGASFCSGIQNCVNGVCVNSFQNVYVSSRIGNAANNGLTPTTPKATIRQAYSALVLSACPTAGCRVHVEASATPYDQVTALAIPAGVSIRGEGLNFALVTTSTGVVLTASDSSTGLSSVVDLDSTAQGVALEFLTVRAADVTVVGRGSFAVRARGARLTFLGIIISSGRGGPGAAGGAGAPYNCGANMAAGGLQQGNCSGGFGDSTSGESGTAAGGAPGNSYCAQACPTLNADSLTPGARGADGPGAPAPSTADPASAAPVGVSSYGVFSGSGWAPVSSPDANRGRNGGGGGGGGAGGAKLYSNCFCPVGLLLTSRGGAGGLAGCGGPGGRGGAMGGPSVALWSLGSFITFQGTNSLEPGQGGTGGAGGDGTPGGTGQLGLGPAAPQTFSCGALNYSAAWGGAGGNGGHGWAGTGGRGGQGGPSIGYVSSGGTSGGGMGTVGLVLPAAGQGGLGGNPFNGARPNGRPGQGLYNITF